MYRTINILTNSPNNIWQEKMKNLKVLSCSSNINNQSGIYQYKNNFLQLSINKIDRFIIQDWLLTCDEKENQAQITYLVNFERIIS